MIALFLLPSVAAAGWYWLTVNRLVRVHRRRQAFLRGVLAR